VTNALAYFTKELIRAKKVLKHLALELKFVLKIFLFENLQFNAKLLLQNLSLSSSGLPGVLKKCRQKSLIKHNVENVVNV
jgi:hypothetical protein